MSRTALGLPGIGAVEVLLEVARELGIPCVNGVAHVVALLQDGDAVTVDGYLGIVTVGAAEFRLEMG